MKTKYVLCFLFSEDLNHVLLITKLKPEWQKGKVNGIGGKVENGETSLQAAIREIEEECGIFINPGDELIEYAIMVGSDFICSCYCCRLDRIFKCEQKELEKPFIVFVSNVPHLNGVTNLTWLVHLALDRLKNKKFKLATIEY